VLDSQSSLNHGVNHGQQFNEAAGRKITMKTTLRAAIMVLGIGSGVAYADNGDGCAATTLFTSIPGEQSTPPASTPWQAAIMIPNGTAARVHVTISRHSTSLFSPASDSGGR
jgi:hypothetical protein